MKTTALKNCHERWTLVFLSAFVLMSLSTTIHAQDRFSLHFRPGVSFTVKDPGEADLETGFGFEGSMAYRFMPHLSVYAGWGWNRFKANDSFAGDQMDFEETGYSFGLQFVHPFFKLPFDYFVRAGLVTKHIELEDPDGNILSDSGHDPGFQAEAGFSFKISERMYLIPGIKYQALATEIPYELVNYPFDLNYLSLGVRLALTF